jgi:RNA polymerase sigma-70 factor (ECF subfamily)
MDDLTHGGWDETPGLDSALVWRVLGDLPAEQRAVVELAYFEGLTLAEIGEILDIPIGTAKSRLFRAMARLRATIGEGGSPG